MRQKLNKHERSTHSVLFHGQMYTAAVQLKHTATDFCSAIDNSQFYEGLCTWLSLKCKAQGYRKGEKTYQHSGCTFYFYI